MNRKLWYLKQLNIFKTLPEKEMNVISSKLIEREYSKRQVMLEPEDKDKVFILKTGRVEIYELTPDGKKITVDILGAGDVFGDLGVREQSDHFVEATTDSFVCVMNKNEFFEMVSRNPQVANTLVKELFTKVIESEKQIAALASDDLLTKVKNLISRLAKKYGKKDEDQTVITVKFTHEQLADMVGISRPTMTEMLNKFERQGIIRRKDKMISFDPQKFANP